ncbi:MAG TPA: glycosyl hydrolase family 65 protein [Sporichthyaceae bacterium]
MISQDAYPVDEWSLRETTLNLDVLAQAESLFALSNGHLGLRGNLDEGEPYGAPGTYLNSFHELRSLPYAEAGYGYPETGESIVNVTNGKLIRILVDDEPFDIRYGDLHDHQRRLDLRTGVLHRTAEWTSPSGARVRLRSRRIVSLTQRAIAAIRVEIEPLDAAVQVVLQSELVANEDMPARSGDPRVAAQLGTPLVAEDAFVDDLRVTLLHSTRRSGLRMAAAMDHEIDGPEGITTRVEAGGDLGRVAVVAQLDPGERLRMTKYLAYGWSARRSPAAVRDQVEAALTAAGARGWAGLLQDQAAALGDFWDRADVRVDGDAQLQQAVRFALFHVHCASTRAERRPVPAKGLTGTGYDGHCFWDTETFLLPVLTYTTPHAAADELRWRADCLLSARQRAASLHLAGAAFPWRTITGAECSAYWPAGTAAFHVNADIADAVLRYINATGDEEFARTVGLPILVETARMWMSLGHFDTDGAFRIDGVTGPDEYSAISDNNVFTNLMVQHNLRGAADCAERHPQDATALEVGPGDIASWWRAADDMFIPYDEELGIHPQSEGFTRHARLDFAALPDNPYPLLLHVPYFDLYRKQVVKQADLVLALHLRGHHFDLETKRRNFDYYEELTVRDSSLSAATQAVVAAEVGHLDLALDYAAEAAFVDLHDLGRNTRDGLHLASLSGTWLALVAGFGGLRDHSDQLAFAPRLPDGLTGLCFSLLYRGARLRVEIDRDSASYTVLSGDGPVSLRHHGEPLTVEPKQTVARQIPIFPAQQTPRQPPGRAPRRHHPR